jgi:hypothetical protein
VRGGRASAPVIGSVRWVLATIVAWEVVQVLQTAGPSTTGSWPVNPFDLLLLTVMPGLAAFAFVRLFLAVVQSGFGSLNTYTLTSSPWAWAFWIGLAFAMVGQGEHWAANTLNQVLPEVVRHGAYGAQAGFLDEDLGHWLLGGGFFLMTLVVMVLGQGAAYRLVGGERQLLAIGSVLTFGFAVVFIGTHGQQIVPAILGSGILTGLALRALPPAEMSRDPVSLLIVPGVSLAGIVLLAWGLLVGGQPAWPW